MKKVFLSLIILAGVSFSALASSNETNRRKAGGDRIVKELNLTVDQQEKIKNLHQDFKAKLKALNADASLTKESKKEKRKSLFEIRQSQVRAILTSEQQAKWEEVKKKKQCSNKKLAKKGFKQGLKNDLNLTEDQKSRLQNLNQDIRSKMQALRNETSFSEEAKREKRKELVAIHRSEIQSLLTAEQQAVMKSKRKENKEKR